MGVWATGRLLRRDCDRRSLRVAICKIDCGRQRANVLKDEADVYRDKLAHLQGKWVPKLYGCYLGETNEGLTGILIMEDCGQPLPRPLCWLPPRYGSLIYSPGASIKHEKDLPIC
ncbi:hypothetical protein NUW54_g12163 [Trametes sanguinea]|uniref:Uncharacterized protein n=1 Tax=Trametes sanguinea TaxID=158606 RepID=A0ACC1N113_9APHY|nr:hypothetical protein NUW54_g12163 [Trametes sanguinea]